MARKAALPVAILPQAPQNSLAPTPRSEDTRLPITDTERALFSACFGRLIDQILAEPD